MKNYVISLTTEQGRRKHISEQFTQQGITFDFFDAILPEQALMIANSLGYKFDQSLITHGELACFISHICLWQWLINSQDCEYIAIFEDDVHLGENSKFFLNNIQWIESHWHLIKLEAFSNNVFLGKPVVNLPFDRKIYTLKGKNYGCAGYILSKVGAQKLLDYLNLNPTLLPLDHVVFEKFIDHSDLVVQQMNPALCIQDNVLQGSYQNLPSDLETLRRMRMKANKKKGLGKLILELTRLITHLKIFVLARQVFFK